MEDHAARAARILRRDPRKGLLARKVGLALVVLLGAGALVWHFETRPEPAPEPAGGAEGGQGAADGRPGEAPPDPDAGLRAEADAHRAALERAAGTAGEVGKDLIERAEMLRDRYARLYQGTSNPFAAIARSLRSRRDLEASARVADLEGRVRRLLEEGKFGEAARLATEGPEPLLREGVMAEGAAMKLRGEVRKAADAAAGKTEAEAAFLDGLERDEELKRLCERSLAAFDGTKHADRFRERLRFIEGRLAAAEARRAEEEEKRRKREEEEEALAKVAVEKGALDPVGLSAILAGPIRSGAFGKRTYKVGAIEGTPAGLDEELVLTLKGPKGGKAKFDDVTVAVQVAMARDGVQGEDLLEAAAFAHGYGLRRDADALLAKYLEGAKGSAAAAKTKIDALLARLRGFNSVPEGGFGYSKDFGWEDGRARADREGAGTAIALFREIDASTRKPALEAAIAKILGILADHRLSTKGRTEVRRTAIDSLESLREKLLVKLRGQVARKGYEELREAALALRGLRVEALKVIFDPEAYLPCDRPDVRKGDAASGQKAVDGAVGALTAAWARSGSIVVSVDPGAPETVDLLDRIVMALDKELYHEPDPKWNAEIDELRSNADPTIDLRRFCFDRGELTRYRRDRAVEAHNTRLKDEAVQGDAKAHIEKIGEYREMLGRGRLAIVPALCRSARRHSIACDAAGRIWTVGDDGTPASRARAEGYDGAVAENIAMGLATPEEIWDRGWYRRSDDHRNALEARHEAMGYGYAGKVGTQVFGAVEPPLD